MPTHTKDGNCGGTIDRTVADVKDGVFVPPDGYREPSGHGHSTSFSTTRRAEYRGRKISVKTTYRIEIDGEPVTVHTMVMNDGTVHCHGLPNYSFPSAVELARALIDAERLAYVEADEIGVNRSHGGQSRGGHH